MDINPPRGHDDDVDVLDDMKISIHCSKKYSGVDDFTRMLMYCIVLIAIYCFCLVARLLYPITWARRSCFAMTIGCNVKLGREVGCRAVAFSFRFLRLWLG